MAEKRRIAIIGIDDAENQFVRAVESYGLEAVHSGPNTPDFVRDCDAAIIVTSYLSHQRFWDSKEWYTQHGKKIFIARQGFTEIQAEFELYFISTFKKQLDTMLDTHKLYYLLDLMCEKPGTKFKYRDFVRRVTRYVPNISDIKLNNFITGAKQKSIIEGIEKKRGVYIYRGLSEKVKDKLKEKYGIEPTSSPEPTAIVTPPQQAPTKEPEKEIVKVNHDDLLLMAFQQLEDKFIDLKSSIDDRLEELNSSMKGSSFKPNLAKDEALRKLWKKVVNLPRVKIEQLEKVVDFISGE